MDDATFLAIFKAGGIDENLVKDRIEKFAAEAMDLMVKGIDQLNAQETARMSLLTGVFANSKVFSTGLLKGRSANDIGKALRGIGNSTDSAVAEKAAETMAKSFEANTQSDPKKYGRNFYKEVLDAVGQNGYTAGGAGYGLQLVIGHLPKGPRPIQHMTSLVFDSQARRFSKNRNTSKLNPVQLNTRISNTILKQLLTKTKPEHAYQLFVHNGKLLKTHVDYASAINVHSPSLETALLGTLANASIPHGSTEQKLNAHQMASMCIENLGQQLTTSTLRPSSRLPITYLLCTHRSSVYHSLGQVQAPSSERPGLQFSQTMPGEPLIAIFADLRLRTVLSAVCANPSTGATLSLAMDQECARVIKVARDTDLKTKTSSIAGPQKARDVLELKVAATTNAIVDGQMALYRDPYIPPGTHWSEHASTATSVAGSAGASLTGFIPHPSAPAAGAATVLVAEGINALVWDPVTSGAEAAEAREKYEEDSEFCNRQLHLNVLESVRDVETSLDNEPGRQLLQKMSSEDPRPPFVTAEGKLKSDAIRKEETVRREFLKRLDLGKPADPEKNGWEARRKAERLKNLELCKKTNR